MSNHKHRQKITIEAPKPVDHPDHNPHPTTHLNYHGDTRGNLGQIMGPNTMGEYLTVVEEVYNPDTDRTRLGLAYGVHKLVTA